MHYVKRQVDKKICRLITNTFQTINFNREERTEIKREAEQVDQWRLIYAQIYVHRQSLTRSCSAPFHKSQLREVSIWLCFLKYQVLSTMYKCSCLAVIQSFQARPHHTKQKVPLTLVCLQGLLETSESVLCHTFVIR